jgi:glycerophosphoryl diester phosphodiesterase
MRGSVARHPAAFAPPPARLSGIGSAVLVRPLLLYAHRGATAELPENTMPAFRRALEIGVDALEMDAHLTRDGVPIISHDPSAWRMAGVKADWKDVDLEIARTWDVGRGYVAKDGSRPFSGQGIRVPTLEQVLVELPGVRINVDLKQATPSMVKPTLAVIRKLGAEDRVTLASFRWRTLLGVRRRGYGGDTALAQGEVMALLATPTRALRRLPYTGAAAQVPVKAGPITFGRKGFIDKCHRLGLRVDFWTVDDPVEVARLLDLGADGIMTDDPAAIAPVFRARRAAHL